LSQTSPLDLTFRTDPEVISRPEPGRNL
jgi:hypothetical protein